MDSEVGPQLRQPPVASDITPGFRMLGDGTSSKQSTADFRNHLRQVTLTQ